MQMLDLAAGRSAVALLPDGLALGGGLVGRRLVEPQLDRGILLAIVAGRHARRRSARCGPVPGQALPRPRAGSIGRHRVKLSSIGASSSA